MNSKAEVRMKVSSLLGGKMVETISPESTLKELTQALSALRIGALVVSTDGHKIQGIVSERDVVQAIPLNFHKLSELHVRDIMTVQVTTSTPDSSVDEIMNLMTEKKIRHVPIVDKEGNLVSIISIGDVVKYQISELSVERNALIDYVKSAG
jgi:CBS domain-containing protein